MVYTENPGGDIMSEIITETELLNELEKYRPSPTELTDEQYLFIKVAREHERPVSWPKIMDLWESKGWGKIKKTTITDKYNRAKRQL